MSENIVLIRLTRNLRYKLTYVKIFETYLEEESNPEVEELLNLLIQAQQTAIAGLSSYLRRQDVQPQELELNEKLMSHAMSRQDTRSRLRFIHDGLQRAVSWYRMQLVDKQLGSDPELRQLFFELGELDASKHWRTEAVMNLLRISFKTDEKTWEPKASPAPRREEDWKPGQVENVGRPSWSGDWSQYREGQSKYSRKDRKD